MKKYNEFINETLTDKQKVYSKIIADMFYDKGLSTHINYDLQGYMMVSAKFDIIENKMFIENIDKTIKMFEFIKSMNKISINTYADTAKGTSCETRICYVFDFSNMDKLDPYFVSLMGLNKFNL